MNLLANMSTTDIAATLQVMRMQEEGGYRSSDYLRPKCSQAGTNPDAVDAECRFKMAEWCYQVVDFCSFSRSTVEIAMSFLDRYLATEVGRPAIDDRKVFQLAAMTCLYTAVKIHEPEAMEPKVIASLSRGTYTEKEVTDMELSILGAIQWRMNPPTSLSFIDSFLALLPKDTMTQTERSTVYELAKFQTELAVNEYTLVTVNASIIAFAAVLNALESVSGSLTMKAMAAVAQMSSIDTESILLAQTRDRLFEIVNRVSATGPLVSQLTPKTPVSTCMPRRGSVHVSPRSVVSRQ